MYHSFNIDLYFMEKFPKATLEYFELFFARARGVFNTELNKLKSEGRTNQLEIESKNNTIAELENLINEKENEVNAICHERDTYRR